MGDKGKDNAMQLSEAYELRKRWNGSKCAHMHLEKEYDLGTATGDYVCTTCGQSGWGNDWPEKIDLERKEK